MKKYCIPFIFVIFLFFNACDKDKEISDKAVSEEPKEEIIIIDKKIDVITRNVVYVPAYARIFHLPDKDLTTKLVTTLAVHNTDMKNPIILKSVCYYSESGQILKKYIDKPRLLKPFATAIYYLNAEDKKTGIGANAVVEWVSEYKVSKPIIEAIMVSIEGPLGISFLSPGYVIDDSLDK